MYYTPSPAPPGTSSPGSWVSHQGSWGWCPCLPSLFGGMARGWGCFCVGTWALVLSTCASGRQNHGKHGLRSIACKRWGREGCWVLGTCSGSNGCCRGRAHHGAQLTLHIPNHLCLSMALQGLMPLLGKAQGRGQQLLAGVQPAAGGAPQTSPRSVPCYPRGASGLIPCPGAQLSPTPQPLSEHGTRLDGAHGVEMPVPVSTAWRSAAAGSPARLFQQHGRALAGSLAAPGARAGAAGAAPLPLPSPASGSTGPTPASPWRGCFPTAGSVPRTPSCL